MKKLIGIFITLMSISVFSMTEADSGLVWSVANKNNEAAEIALKNHGANPNTMYQGYSMMTLCTQARYLNLRTAALLIQHGYDPSEASNSEAVESFDELLMNFAGITYGNEENQASFVYELSKVVSESTLNDALIEATKGGILSHVKILVEAGAHFDRALVASISGKESGSYKKIEDYLSEKL